MPLHTEAELQRFTTDSSPMVTASEQLAIVLPVIGTLWKLKSELTIFGGTLPFVSMTNSSLSSLELSKECRAKSLWRTGCQGTVTGWLRQREETPEMPWLSRSLRNNGKLLPWPGQHSWDHLVWMKITGIWIKLVNHAPAAFTGTFQNLLGEGQKLKRSENLTVLRHWRKGLWLYRFMWVLTPKLWHLYTPLKKHQNLWRVGRGWNLEINSISKRPAGIYVLKADREQKHQAHLQGRKLACYY